MRWLDLFYRQNTSNQLLSLPVKLVNKDHEIERTPLFNRNFERNLYILPNMDFSKRDLIQEHYSLADVLSRVGSWFAILMPILNLSVPCVLIYYLYRLSLIIQNEEVERYRLMQLNLLKVLVGKIKSTPNLNNKHTMLANIVSKNLA